MLDLQGAVVVEVRDAAAVAAITPRVRGGELAPGDAPPAVVIVALGRVRSPHQPGRNRLGLQQARYVANCYGATRIQANELAGAVSDAIHIRGPRVTAGKQIRLSLDDGGGEADTDPDTKWPLTRVLIDVIGDA